MIRPRVRTCNQANESKDILTDGKLDARNTPDTLCISDMKNFLSILLLWCISMSAYAELTVFAASSTTDVLKELAARFERSGGESIRFNFASSGALARQIDAGAPADLYISAHIQWMDFLAEKNLLIDGTRFDLAGNTLVLVAPIDSTMTLEGFPNNLKGRLAVGDFKSVPAGTYAEASLRSLGWLNEVQGKLIRGSSVRTVLMYVERGEVDAGIVYLTDAVQSKKVKVLGNLPAESHPPILYPAACVKSASASARAFLDFLVSEDAEDVWKKYGFAPLMR